MDQDIIQSLEQRVLALEEANRALTQREAQYKTFFENNPLPMWVYDLETCRFLTVNHAATIQYGYSHEEFLSMTLDQIRPDEDVPLLHENIKNHHEIYQQSGPWRHKLKHGPIIYVEITSHEVDFEGREARLVLAQNITERKTAEDALRISEENLQKAQWVANVGSWIWRIQANTLDATEQTFRIFGLEKHDFQGGLAKLVTQAIHPDDQELVFQSHFLALNHKKPFPLEFRIIRPDGSVRTVWVESGDLTLDQAGIPLMISGIVQDITERKQAEKQMQENEERLRLALYASQQGIYDLNVQTGDAIVNDIYAAMLGYDPAVFVESNDRWLERLHPDERAFAEKYYYDYIAGKISEYKIEFRQKTADQRWIWLLSVGKVIERDVRGQPLRMMGIHMDITERKNIELKLQESLAESQQRLQRIEVLHDIDLAIGANTHLDPILGILLEKVKSQLKVDAVDVLLYDEESRLFRYAASLGFHNPRVKKGQVLFCCGLAEKVAECKDILQIKCLHKFELDPDFRKLIECEGFSCYYGIPLIATGRVIGVLELFHASCLDPDPEWMQYFHALGGQAAVAIENSQLIEGLKNANTELTQAYDATIAGWSLAMDLRDKETEGHTQRVMQMTVALARKIGLPEKDIQFIRRGALLHDIGKIGIPDAILLKPGFLTDEEFYEMKKHPLYAYKMLQSIDYLIPALDIPHLHHEKWDGSGYPHGLKGAAVPLPARIFAIVDVYDALTSDRPYRQAWSKAAALEHIRQESGKHFDPDLVNLFMEFMTEERVQ